MASVNAGESPKALRLSYSRLQSFGNCPAQYRFHYLLKEPELGTSIEAFLGRRLHEVLEWLYKLDANRSNQTLDNLFSFYRKNWADNWDGNVFIARAGWRTDDYYQLGQRELARYFRQYSPFDTKVVAVEKKYTLTLNGAPHLSVVGIVDRIDQPADGHWIISDYKSGKRMLPQAKTATDLQMQIYFLALKSSEEEVDRVDIVWHYLQHDKQVTLSDVDWETEKITARLIKKGDSLIEAERNPDLMKPKESALCGWCYYWHLCPAKVGQVHPAKRAL